MEKCKFIARRLSLYLDGECSEEERESIVKHISRCKHCQNQLILFRTSRLALKSIPNLKLPAAFDNDFIDKLNHLYPFNKKNINISRQ